MIEFLANNYPVLRNDTLTLILRNTFAVVIRIINTGYPASQNLSIILGNSFNFHGIEESNIIQEISNNATASVSTPESLFAGLSPDTQAKIVYTIFLDSQLFLRRRIYIQHHGFTYNRIGSLVLSTYVANVTTLRQPVQLRFLKNPVSELQAGMRFHGVIIFSIFFCTGSS